MSLSLGHGRRFDHHLRNQHNPEHSPPSPRSFGTSTLNTQSTSTTITNHPDPDEPALARFARLKQSEQALNSRATKSGVFNSPPKPEKWSVKDTSVNIATAFHQAAATAYDMQATNPNNSWASGRSVSAVPRSTSVEYEKEAAVRRHAALGAPRSTSRRKPLTKNTSVRNVPDSEGEEEPAPVSGRGKSPFEQVLDITKRALAPATFYLRQRSQDPDNAQRATNGDESSYDYAAEEAEYQAIMNQPPSSRRGPAASHKRNRMSLDNKAYRPTASDLEDEDGDFDNEGRKIRRRRKKRESVGGPLTTLPVASYDKKKRRKSRGSKGNLADMEEDESDSDDNTGEQVQHTGFEHASASREPPPVPVSRGSVLPQYSLRERPEDPSTDMEQGLESIPEVAEDPTREQEPQANQPIPSQSSKPSFSIGAILGKCARGLFLVGSGVVVVLFRIVGLLLFIFGSAFGTVYDVLVSRPAKWLTGVRSRMFVQLGKYALMAGIIYAAWYTLHEPLMQWIPTQPWIGPIRYHAPEVPPSNIAELLTRLRTLEIALSGLAQEHDSARFRLESEARGRTELGGLVGSLEEQLQQEKLRVTEAEALMRQLANKGLPGLKQELEALQAQVGAHGSRETGETDEESRARVLALEARVDGVEGGLKEALEIGRASAKAGGGSVGATVEWWKKLASGSSSDAGMTIKSADGQDVTALIGYLVDVAVSKYGKDVIARPDFALHSSGARIIPSLTSPTFETSPTTLRGQIVGLLTGNGYAIGRPPITALHHELHSGNCWPFAGSKGQLGVALSAPTYISDVTIDHVAKEVAFDMRSAPQAMELWGMVEGRENIARVRKWQAEKARQRKEGGLPSNAEEELAYPRTLPLSPQYFRIASFSYDIHSPHNIQTFPVSQEIRDLGVDFGIVVLMVKSNWGRADFTCLYRLRVHGQRLGDVPLPAVEA